MSKFVTIMVGAAEFAAGTIAAFSGFGAAAAPWLLQLGAATMIGGAGTLLSGLAGNHLGGLATTLRNPIAPWKVIYGRVRTGGTLVYVHTWGDDNKMIDMVIVIAAHRSKAIDGVLFDQQRLQFDTSAKPVGAHASAGTSFTPVQQRVNIASITRRDGVVTVQLATDLTYIAEGDQVRIGNITTDASLNGTVQVGQILSRASGIRFTYLSGGANVTISSQGRVETLWADYGRKVYFEPLLGEQTLGQTFAGMSGTPYDGDRGNMVNPDDVGGLGGNSKNSPNPWTANCSLQGKTAVFLRLHYNDKYFKGGLPQISFLVRGKNDILDPREDGEFRSYTENAALCIADFLADRTWGFRANYGTDIPYPELIAAANLCDEEVPQARSTETDIVTEPAYTCNGQFDLTMRRGEVLENLLTSCAGRLRYMGGQYTIWPGGWYGNSFAIGSNPGMGIVPLPDFNSIAAGPISWSPAVSIRETYNGVKGTYISPANKWMASDFPPYAQDSRHGYDADAPEGDANMAEDGGDRRWLDVQLPFTISPSAAQRIAKIELLRRRQQGSGQLTLNMAGYQIAPLDLLLCDISFLQWNQKQLEVRGTRLRMDAQGDGQAPGLVVELDIQSADPSVYAWSTSEELSPQGYVQPAIPGIGSLDFFAKGEIPGVSVPYPWSPAGVAPYIGDALYPGPVKGDPATNRGRGTFRLQVRYARETDGGPVAYLDVSGVTPPTRLAAIAPPQITCTSGASGTLPAGTYVFAVCAFDTSSPAQRSRLSVPVEITIPDADDGSGSVSINVSWPPDSDGGEVYVAWDDETRGYHRQGALAAVDTSYDFTEFDQFGPGAPDEALDHVSIAWIKVAHGGPWAQQLTLVTANTITIGGSFGMTTDMWAGRVLTLLGKLDSTQSLIDLNMPVVATSAADINGYFTLTIGPNSNGDQLPDLTTLLVPGDVLLMRYSATFTDTGWRDPLISNPYYPDGATGFEEGRRVMVLTGPDAGDIQTVATVAEDEFGKKTIYHLAAPWRVRPNDGDIVIVLEADSGPETHGQSLSSATEIEGVVASPVVTNLSLQTWLFIARTHSAQHRNGDDAYAATREAFIFGSQGTRTIRISQTMLETDSKIDVDASGGGVVFTLLPFVQIPNAVIYIQKIDSSANPVVWQCSSGDTINGEGSGILATRYAWIQLKVSGNG